MNNAGGISAAPWKVRLELRRLALIPAARLVFAMNGIRWTGGWKIFGLPVIQRHRRSAMEFGEGLTLRSWTDSNPLGPNHPVILSTREEGAAIRIGRDFGMTGGTLCAARSITIGDRVLVGANCVITDTDFHPLDPETRRRDPSAGKAAPVFIEDDVFIGMNVIVLKGVRIGRGSVIGAGTVVASDVPPGCIFAGNPGRIVRRAGEGGIR